MPRLALELVKRHRVVVRELQCGGRLRSLDDRRAVVTDDDGVPPFLCLGPGVPEDPQQGDCSCRGP